MASNMDAIELDETAKKLLTEVISLKVRNNMLKRKRRLLLEELHVCVYFYIAQLNAYSLIFNDYRDNISKEN